MTRRSERRWRAGLGVDARLGLLLLALLSVVVALVGPAATLERDVFRYVFVIDVTQSMNTADAGSAQAPRARSEFSRDVVRLALQALPCGSEAGLAAFTEYRTLLLFAPVEVCANYGTLSVMLEGIDWRMAWAASSEVAKGLYSSLRVASELGADTRLVFLTDGHEAPPLHPQLRPGFGGRPGEVKGLIAGVGGARPTPIPHLGPEGEVLGYWTADEVMQIDRFSLGRSTSVAGGEAMEGIEASEVRRRIAEGTEHLSYLREAYLEGLARETGLEYRRLETAHQLAELVTRPALASQKPTITDLAWLPGSVAMLSVLLACLLHPLGSVVGKRRVSTR